jgi:hypothetical protein
MLGLVAELGSWVFTQLPVIESDRALVQCQQIVRLNTIVGCFQIVLYRMLNDGNISDFAAALGPKGIFASTNVFDSLILGQLPPSTVSVFTAHMSNTLMRVVTITLGNTLNFNTYSHCKTLHHKHIV